MSQGISRECELSCATFVHCVTWRPSRFSVDPSTFSARSEKKKTLQKVTGKFRGRRDGSLCCSRSDQRCLLPIIRRHPSSSHDGSQGRRSIDRFPRATDSTFMSQRTPAEHVNGSSQFPSCEIYPSFQKPPPLRITLFSRRFFLFFFSLFLHLFSLYLFFCCCCSCCCVILL